MSETLLDFSTHISDYEYVTQNKIVDIVDSLNIEHIFVKKINNTFIQNYIILFPKKTFFFTVTLYGGGTSGMKVSFTSSMAQGGYSSGAIVRFPIEIKNESGTHFAKVRIGKGGDSFDITEKIRWNNGEYSNFDLVQSKETNPNPYETEKGRTNVTIVEALSSYGSGKLNDGTIIEATSTNTYFAFNGSNTGNTFVRGTGTTQYPKEDRYFYAPYTNEYNGYNSFIGIGGDYLGDIDGEENTGAGGAGVFNNSSRRVGKGGNGGCILEYEGNDKIEIYADGYLFIPNGNNKIVFIIYDSGTGSRNIEIEFESGIYCICYIVEYIKQILNETIIANVLYQEAKLIIKMASSWTIDTTTSSGDLLIDLGILNSDLYHNNELKRATLVDGSYQLPFSKQVSSLCKLDLFNSNQVFE